MSSPSDPLPPRIAKQRKRFEDTTASAAPVCPPDAVSAEAPNEIPPEPEQPDLAAAPSMTSENTMSGGIVVPGQNTFLGDSLGETGAPEHTLSGGIVVPDKDLPLISQGSDHTLSGGLGYIDPPKRLTRIPFAPAMPAASDGTRSGGLGYAVQHPHAHNAPQQINTLKSLPRARKFDDISGAPIAQPRPAIAPSVDPSVWKVGDTIEGKYDVTAIAGQGGMGVVYKVRHREWNIEMAVKTPLPALVKDAAAKARFLREAQIWVDLGLHPNLVQCWYVRELGGLPRVFVDYLAGGSLKDWFVSKRVGPGKWALIIDLIVQACDGLGYAHERGVVHRDIKPGNMLMSPDGRLCITDFGIVKLAGVEDIASSDEPNAIADTSPVSADLTRTGLSLGTPQYGAPEQWGQARHVDARADIYALGITLYELCCGRRPFDETGKGEPPQIIIARHVSSRPPDPRTIFKDLPDPLAALALKCLAKNPADRPQTLADVRLALADAHLAIFGIPFERLVPEIAESRASGLNNRAVSMWDLGQPAQAVGAWKEALTLDSRHAESLYNSSLIEMRKGKTSDFDIEKRLREAAKFQRKALLYLGHIQLETCDAAAAEASFRDALTDPSLVGDAIAWRALGHASMALEHYREAEAAYTKALAVMPHDEASKIGITQSKRCERVVNGRLLYPNIHCQKVVEDRVGSARAIVVAADGRSIYTDGPDNSICQFELPTGRILLPLRGQSRQVLSLSTTPDGIHLIGGGEDSILRRWTTDKGTLTPHFYGKGHIGAIESIAISPDSSTAATCGNDNSVRLWELQTGTQIRAFWDHSGEVCAVAFSPDGQRLFSASIDATIRSWEIPSGSPGCVLRSKLTPVMALAFSTDGRFLYSGGRDGRILKWDYAAIASGQTDPCGIDFIGHRDTVNALAVVPNTRFLLSASDDNTARIWDADTGHCLRTLTGFQGAVNAIAVTPDGHLAISGSNEHLGKPLRLWALELDRYTREPNSPDPYAAGLYVCRIETQSASQTASRQFKNHITEATLAFDAGQYPLAYAELKKARKVEGYERDPHALELNAKLTQKLPLKQITAAYLHSEIEGRQATGFKSVVFAANGSRAFSAGRNDKSIGAWDVSSAIFMRLVEGHKQPVEALALTADGTTLLSASSDYSVGIWDAINGTLKTALQGHRAEVNALAISRDNRQAASASNDGSVKLWDIASGKCLKTFEKEHSAEALTAVRFMPDGRALFAGGRDGSVSLWSLVLGKCVREFPGHSGGILDIAVVSDKPQFLTAGEDKSMRLWDAENGQSLWLARDTKARFNSIVLSPDARFIFSGGLEGPNTSINIWEASTGKHLQSLCPHTKGIAALALSPDGCKLLTGSEDKFLRVWDLEWELLSNDPLSALAVQLRKPPTPAGFSPTSSGVSTHSGFNPKEATKPSGEIQRPAPDDTKKSRPSIFLDGRSKPKNP